MFVDFYRYWYAFYPLQHHAKAKAPKIVPPPLWKRKHSADTVPRHVLQRTCMFPISKYTMTNHVSCGFSRIIQAQLVVLGTLKNPQKCSYTRGHLPEPEEVAEQPPAKKQIIVPRHAYFSLCSQKDLYVSRVPCNRDYIAIMGLSGATLRWHIPKLESDTTCQPSIKLSECASKVPPLSRTKKVNRMTFPSSNFTLFCLAWNFGKPFSSFSNSLYMYWWYIYIYSFFKYIYISIKNSLYMYMCFLLYLFEFTYWQQ